MDMNHIFSDEENLLKIVNIIFEISCIEIPKLYEDNESSIHYDEISKKFIEKKNIILAKILSDFLNIDNDFYSIEILKDIKGCDTKVFLANFINDRFVNKVLCFIFYFLFFIFYFYIKFMTSGYVRNLAYKIIDPDNKLGIDKYCLIF
jgi:hypothetical protein